MGDDIELTNMAKERPESARGGSKSSTSSDSHSSLPAVAVDVEVKAGGDDTVIEPLLNADDDEKKERKRAMKERLSSNSFAGLTKEELEVFSKDPHWKKVRLVLFVLFWIVWVLLLVGAVLIVLFSAKCPPRPDVPFYQKDLVYKVLPLSYAVNQNGNNWGDLIGLNNSLGYIKSLGASTIVIGPLLTANSKNNALYDSVGSSELDSSVGHFVPCLQTVTKTAMKLKLKVLVEVQINFVSVYHPYFYAQLSSSTPTVGPFVVQLASDVASSKLTARDGLSVWRPVSKIYSNVTGNYVYYSSFTPDVVEWNFTTPEAKNNASDIVKKFLLQDIDGVVVKDASFLSECPTLLTADESLPAANASDFANNFWKLAHPCTLNQNGSVDVIRQLAQVVKQRNDDEDRRKRVLLVELAGTTGMTEYSEFVADGAADGAYLDTITQVGYTTQACNITCVRRRIESVANGLLQPSGKLRFPMWQLSTPEYGRFTTRFGSASAPALLTLSAFLPGGFNLYYGDEAAVADVGVANSSLDQLFFTKGFRSTMQWTANQPYAGFLASSNNYTTLDSSLVGPTDPATYLTANSLVQNSVGYSASRTNMLLNLVKARRNAESAQWGSYYSLTDALVRATPTLRSSLIAFLRVAVGFDPVLVIVNGLGNTTATQIGTLPLGAAACNALRTSAEWSSAFSSQPTLSCLTGSVLFANGPAALNPNDQLSLGNVFIDVNQVLVVRFTPTVPSA